MVELRKRKPAAEPPAPTPSKRKSSNSIKTAVEKAKSALGGGSSTTADAEPPIVGQQISLNDFGGEIETNDGIKTTLQKLVQESRSGVVLFTYPKASTPGCTTQACLFRDAYTHLTSTGLAIYGLSNDSPAANTNFKTKQSLPYPLLCDPSQTLIAAIGFQKEGNKTTRGVFVINKSGKVLAAEPGGPQATVDVVAGLIKDGKIGNVDTTDSVQTAQAVQNAAAEAPATHKEDSKVLGAGTEPSGEQGVASVPPPSVSDKEAAATAADVAETAAKVDGEDAPKL